MARASVALTALLLTSGCVAVDTTIRNPVTSGGAIDANQIEKRHGYAERARGLPPGTLSDLATLTRVGADLCFEAVLHELDPIDMSSVRARLEADGQPTLDQAQLWPTPPRVSDVPGLVPQRVPTGIISTYCSARDYVGNCMAWSSQPTYATLMEPGTVQIYETHARMCFPNRGYVTQKTRWVKLELTVPRPAKTFETSYVGFGWVWGAGDKRTSFVWGLASGANK